MDSLKKKKTHTHTLDMGMIPPLLRRKSNNILSQK